MQPMTGENRYRVYTRTPEQRGQRQTHVRRDPAPSIWAYRMQRLWLTPLWRVTFRVGIPAFLIASSVGLYLRDDGRRAAMYQTFADLTEKFQNRPEFMVGLVEVQGASPDLAEAIRARMGLKLPVSSFNIDIVALQTKIEELDAVAQADLKVRTGGVLEVAITERIPAMVWRRDGRIEMLDATGARVAGLSSRADRADLPLIAGEGADLAADEALELFAAAASIQTRIRGLVRVGERRWDLVLDRNQKIQLPEKNAVAALERLITLDKAEDLLARDILGVDLRNEQRPVLRLAPYALNEHRKALGIDTSGSDL